MSRPALTTVNSTLAAWDAVVAGNFTKIGSAPLPIYENATLTESNLAATFPAAAHDRCFVWVNHSVLGYTLYYSDGTNWLQYGAERRSLRSSAVTTSQVAADKVIRFTGAGGVTLNLLAIASWKGQTIQVINDTAGNVTLDGNAAETVDGAATVVLAAGTRRAVYNDGTALYTL